MLQALDASGLKKDDISSVEVVGSSSRVPALLALMREVFGKEPGRTLNAKECVSRGCALNCAMLSPIFRCLSVSLATKRECLLREEIWLEKNVKQASEGQINGLQASLFPNRDVSVLGESQRSPCQTSKNSYSTSGYDPEVDSSNGCCNCSAKRQGDRIFSHPEVK